MPNPATPGLLKVGTLGTSAAGVDSFAVADIIFDCGGAIGQATALTFIDIVAGDLAEDALPSVGVNGSISPDD